MPDPLYRYLPFLSSFSSSFPFSPPRTAVVCDVNHTACTARPGGSGITSQPQNPGDPYARTVVGGWNWNANGTMLSSSSCVPKNFHGFCQSGTLLLNFRRRDVSTGTHVSVLAASSNSANSTHARSLFLSFCLN